MSRNETKTPETRLSEGPEMVAEMRAGVLAALEEHKRLGQSIVTYDLETGEIQEVPPERIPTRSDQPIPAASTL